MLNKCSFPYFFLLQIELLEHTQKPKGRISLELRIFSTFPGSSSEQASGNTPWELQSQEELKHWKGNSKNNILNTQTHKAVWLWAILLTSLLFKC